MLRADGAVPSGVGMTAPAGLGRGERALDMVLASRDGTPTRYYAHAGGRPALLVLADEACVARLHALAPEQCAELIAVWEQQGHSQTGVESSTGGGCAEQRNAQLKRRRDHIVRDPRRSRELATTIGRRVLPELSKAFAYRASRFEGFKIACYQASDRGFFSAHRDNLSPATAHRRFARTLHLNDGYQIGR